MNKVLKLTISGALSGNFIFTMLTILSKLSGSGLEYLADDYISLSLVSMLIGIGFTMPAAIYSNSSAEWQNTLPYKKILFHLGFGLGFAYLGLYYMSLITKARYDLLTSTVIMIIIFFTIWSSSYWYSKKESKKINMQINDIQDDKNANFDNQSHESNIKK